MQEPLRGISKTSYRLKEEAEARLEAADQEAVETVIRLSARMSDMIQATLHYARAGQGTVDKQPVDMNEVLRSVLEVLSLPIAETRTQVRYPEHLPPVSCDRQRTAAVLQNLISNAIKYNDQAEREIEIGYLDTETPVFFVRDNGIGIDQQHQDAIFTLFRRLHHRDAYGGGTGAGLTIARKHLEKQGDASGWNRRWGEGSTFFFSFGAP